MSVFFEKSPRGIIYPPRFLLLQGAADEVENLGGDLLLTAFVVLKGEGIKEIPKIFRKHFESQK